MISVSAKVLFLPPTARIAALAALCLLGLAACDPGKQAAAPAAADGSEASAEQAADSMEGMDHSKMDHAAMGHGDMMTPAQFKELREKIPLYQVLTDEQIMENMGRMPPDWWEVLSAEDEKGKVGVLALGHGYSLGGNEQFKEKVSPIAKAYPTAVAPGMAMMSGSHIQKAVDALTSEHGVETLVVVPMEPGDETSLNHQWQYILGLRDEAPYLTVPQVKTSAKVVFTKSPIANPIMADIMGDYATETATDPSKARLIIVSHGPEKVEDNDRELALLREHADRIRANTDFVDIQVLSLQDDAVPEVRAANKAKLRSMIQEASDEGREVVIVPMILTRGGFHARLKKDLDGLTYEFANRGLIEHPAFQAWISTTVENAVS
jgi:hypothetical protein